MFSPQSLPPLSRQSHRQFTPHKPSPLSSSPLRSSPLSPRDTNVPSRSPSQQDFQLKMASSPPDHTTKPQSLPTPSSSPLSARQYNVNTSSFAKTPIKVNPLFGKERNGCEGPETRRKLFLKNVRERQEEKRWQGRGGDEEIERMLWVAEERRRRERVEREGRVAGNWLGEEEQEEEEGWVGSQMVGSDAGRESDWDRDARMAEEIARREEEELDALLEMNGSIISQSQESRIVGDNENGVATMEGGGSRRPGEDHPSETPYGSDEEDYDNLFMEVIRNEQQEGVDQDMMDMS